MQVDARERGFSYSYDAPLDMRMDPSQELDAREVVNTMDERRLAQGAVASYGEERNARAIAREIVRRRRARPDRDHRRAGRRRRSGAAGRRAAPVRGELPAKRVFQAIRIVVNDELEDLDRALPAAWSILRPRRPPRRDLLPLARGPARQALPGRPRARLHLPARPARVRLRADARGRADHAPRRGARRPARSPTTRARARHACAPPAASRRGRA